MKVQITLDWEDSVQLLNILSSKAAGLKEGSLKFCQVEYLMQVVNEARHVAAVKANKASEPVTRYKVSDGVHGKSDFDSVEAAEAWFWQSELQRASVFKIVSTPAFNGRQESETRLHGIAKQRYG